MAPGRPVVYPDQVGLVLFSLLAIGGGVYMAIRVVIG